MTEKTKKKHNRTVEKHNEGKENEEKSGFNKFKELLEESGMQEKTGPSQGCHPNFL